MRSSIIVRGPDGRRTSHFARDSYNSAGGFNFEALVRRGEDAKGCKDQIRMARKHKFARRTVNATAGTVGTAAAEEEPSRAELPACLNR